MECNPLGALRPLNDHDLTRPHAILWRRLDRPGYEAAHLEFRGGEWHLTGTAVFADGDLPCRLDYAVVCDATWCTRRTRVTGWIGLEPVEFRISAGPDRRWQFNGVECPLVVGCVDVDLGFTPSTNLLPIRRLGLAPGEAGLVKAAWLRFPGFAFEPLEQLYRRETERRYLYESGGGRFSAPLEVNEVGFVTRYGRFWLAEAQRPTSP